jgi:chemotaxis-related protein WspB
MLVLTFHIGPHRLALDIRRVREVVPRVQLQRLAGSPDYLAGLFVYRGRPVPVLDLHRLLDAGECPPHLSSRIVLVPLPRETGEETLLGLLAAGVADIRDVGTVGQDSNPAISQRRDQSPAPRVQVDLGLTLVEGSDIVHLIDLDRLLPAPVQDLLDALPAGSVL